MCKKYLLSIISFITCLSLAHSQQRIFVKDIEVNHYPFRIYEKDLSSNKDNVQRVYTIVSLTVDSVTNIIEHNKYRKNKKENLEEICDVETNTNHIMFIVKRISNKKDSLFSIDRYFVNDEGRLCKTPQSSSLTFFKDDSLFSVEKNTWVSQFVGDEKKYKKWIYNRFKFENLSNGFIGDLPPIIKLSITCIVDTNSNVLFKEAKCTVANTEKLNTAIAKIMQEYPIPKGWWIPTVVNGKAIESICVLPISIDNPKIY